MECRGDTLRVSLNGCNGIQGRRAFTYTGGAAGYVERPLDPLLGGTLEEKVPPYSITVFELAAAPATQK